MSESSHDVSRDASAGQDERYTGKSVARLEDRDILTGNVDYIHDIQPPNSCEMALVRSPHAHAHIMSIDTEAAESHPGCQLVVTAADLKAGYEPMPGRLGFSEWVLADEKVRFTGEPVAAVIADDRYAAEDAAEEVDVEYETLEPTVESSDATDDNVLVHEDRGTNIADTEDLRFGDVDEAFENADRVFEDEFSWGRISGVPLETAGVVARYEPDTDSFQLDCNMQLYTFNGNLISEALGYPEDSVELQVPENIGGSYGTKIMAGIRYCVIAAVASHMLERPVKFVEDRIEYLQGGDSHSCEREYEVRLAVEDDEITGLDISFVDNLGAFPRYPLPQTAKPLAVLTTSYEIPNVRYAYELVLSNKVPQTAYRGFGVQQHNFALEMMVGKAARALGEDPTQFRWKNLIQPEQMPYKLPSKNVYDSGDYPAALTRIEDIVDENERCEGGLLDPRRLEELAEDGIYRGVQPAVVLEPSVGVIDYADRFEMTDEEIDDYSIDDVDFFPEYLRADIHPDGTIEAYLATGSAGQGHQTVVAQVLADGLGVTPDDIEVSYLNSVDAPDQFGAAASRMGVMFSSTAEKLSEEVIKRVRERAADVWDCDAEEVAYHEGALRHVASGESISLAELGAETGESIRAEAEYANPALSMEEFDEAFEQKLPSYPATAYTADAPIVEVNANTGEVEVLKYYSVHDCGTVLNPQIVNGQVEGAVAHGVGAALLEEFGYDDEGQPLAVTMFDYLLPSIKEVPRMELEHRETPSPFTTTGAKGAGEGGTIAASAMIPAAINDALEPLDVTIDSVPVTPEHIRDQIREAGSDE
ncbi:xanthine dehydrogenase family protein molybdopterin-binding subunit [Haloarcula sp. JP-L23]|uniref:xanthine dehydrogenase family protein molybdopterin-binding subunit n=1 Tax=Haloarcula sp. JP-L23 TaxID=2716717 RepID=UPI00140EDAC4|nr:xanthine dehydrogenase family protein molybdopterin-binding subunit [Haloarcula sp. JP-L23]